MGIMRQIFLDSFESKVAAALYIPASISVGIVSATLGLPFACMAIAGAYVMKDIAIAAGITD